MKLSLYSLALSALFSAPLAAYSVTLGMQPISGNNVKVDYVYRITGIKRGDSITSTPKGVTVSEGAILQVVNRNAPTKIITINFGALISGSTVGSVSIGLDSATLIGISGSYSIATSSMANYYGTITA